MRCGDALNACECDEQIPVSEVLDLMAMEMEEVYHDADCLDICVHLGELDCPPYRAWLTAMANGDPDAAKPRLCGAFEDDFASDCAEGGAAGG